VVATRLLAIIDTVQVSGPGKQLAALLVALRERGTNARVLTIHRTGRPSAPFVTHLESLGIPCTVIPERGRFDPFLAWRAGRVVREFQPHVVQTHSYKATVLAWLLRRMGYAFSWVGCFHGATDETTAVRAYHRLDIMLLRTADRTVIMSETQRTALGSGGRRALVINNAVLPPDAPVADDALARLPDRNGTLAFIGRLSPEKGCDLLLDALAVLAEGHPELDWNIIIAGDGPERGQLEAQAAELLLTPRVQFLGQVARVSDLYRAVQCVVLPSRSEGLPNVLLEAIAANCSVVATSVGAIPTVVGGSAAAILIPPGDANALARAMHQVLVAGEDPGAGEARRRVVAEYSLATRVGRFEALYAELLEVPNAPPPSSDRISG